MQRVFSHSSLNSYETCPKKYWFRYVAQLPVESEGVEAFVGKRVHEVMERLLLFTDSGQIPRLERVVERFQALWDEHFDPDRLRIVRKETSFEDYRKLGVRCVENGYRRLYPFDRGVTLGLERKIQFHLDADGEYAVRGVIDRVVRAPDGALEIIDYKTGKRVPSRPILERDRQLALYEIGLRKELGHRGEVRLIWHYLASDQVRTSQRSEEQLDALQAKTRSVIDQIRNETRWEPREGTLCQWCEYREVCPLFAGMEAHDRALIQKGRKRSPRPTEAEEDAADQLNLL